MEVHSLASGSSGNAYIIKDQNNVLLLDAGLSGKLVQAGLAELNIDSNRIRAILVTHEHNDHIAGAGVISRRFNLPLYMTAGTWERAAGKLGKIKEDNIRLVSQGMAFSLGNLEITAIPVSHDASEPVNYVFDTGKHRAVVLTDTGCITSSMLKSLATCHAMVLEANHDVEMLRTGPYPWPLKQRVAGQHGHLSNLQAAKVAAWLAVHGRIQSVHLGHLSAVNNYPQLAESTVSQYLIQEGLDSEPIFSSLKVLPRQRRGPVLQVK